MLEHHIIIRTEVLEGIHGVAFNKIYDIISRFEKEYSKFYQGRTFLSIKNTNDHEKILTLF